MEPGRQPSEVERLQQKLAETTDEDVASALRLKIASLQLESEQDGHGEAGAAESAMPTPKTKVVPLTPEEGAALRRQLAHLELEVDRIDDLDIRDAVDKQIIALHMRLAGHVRVVPEAEIPRFEPTDPKQVEAADALLREARVERMRGNRKRADELLTEAASKAPNSPAVLLALAQEASDSRQPKKASELLSRAKSIAPDDPAIERAYGEIVLKSNSSMSIEDQLRAALSEDALIDPNNAYASPKTAAILSFFAPGLGQMVLGMVQKGAMIMGFWALMIFWVFLMREDVSGLLGMAGLGHGGKSPNMIVLLPIIAAVVTHIGSVAGCSALARTGRTRPSSSRPAPPVNLPFE